MHWNELDIVEGTISKGRGKAAFLPQKMIEKGDSGACYHQKSIEKGPSYLCEPSHGMWLARCLLGLDLNYLWCVYLSETKTLGCVLYTKNRTKFRFVTVRNGRKKVSYFFLFFRTSKVGQVMCYRCCGTSVYLFFAKTSSLQQQFILLSYCWLKILASISRKVAKNANTTLFGLGREARALREIDAITESGGSKYYNRGKDPRSGSLRWILLLLSSSKRFQIHQTVEVKIYRVYH